MVAISGTVTKRVPRPTSSSTAPPISAEVARNAISAGAGSPSPHSVLPNHSTTSPNDVALFMPATQNTGTR